MDPCAIARQTPGTEGQDKKVGKNKIKNKLKKDKTHFQLVKEKHDKKHHKVRSAKPGSRSFLASLISMFITTVYFMYLNISRATMDVINCQDTDPPSGKYYMASQPLEECGVAGGLQLRVLPAALVFLIFYCVGFPVTVVFVFWLENKQIMSDQILRAHGRGMHPATNPNYEFRMRFSRLYYQYKPTCYWWIVVIVVRKFAICFAGVALRSSATFQLCFALVVMFSAFVLQVIYHPFLGIRERGNLLREENTKNMQHESKRLRAMLVVQQLMDKDINSDDPAFQVQRDQQEKIRSLDTEREAIDNIINHKHRWWNNENNIELTLLACSVLVPLAGIMFNSRYLEREGTESTKSLITYTVIVVVVSSVFYFIAVFSHAIFHSAEANRISAQIYWARLRINLNVVVQKMKGRAKSRARLAGGIKNVTSSQASLTSVNNTKGNPVEASHVAIMAEMMAKLESQISRLENKDDRTANILKEVSVRVARQEMVSKSIHSLQRAAVATRDAPPVRAPPPRRPPAGPPAGPPAVAFVESTQVQIAPAPGPSTIVASVARTQNPIQRQQTSLNSLMMSSSEEDSD